MLKGIFRRVAEVFTRTREIDEDFYLELQDALVTSDVSVKTTALLVDWIEAEVTKQEIRDAETARGLLKEKIVSILMQNHKPAHWPADTPGLFLVVGVNGTGKTTTIAKLAQRAKADKKQVVLAAGDTFRAAAGEQLEIWGERLGIPVVRGRDGSDPAAVVFDAIQSARARHADLVIADTAGRLHTKHNLMAELGKIYRISTDKLGREPDEVLLVVDATTGQNALVQTQQFAQVVKLTGVVLTKLDSTAKGGSVITIADETGLPIKYIGVGEAAADLQDFDPHAFADAILAGE
jgi:fused signal recognition particle receptor